MKKTITKMILPKIYYCLFLFLSISFRVFAQPESIKRLEKEVVANNDNSKYVESIVLISKFIDNPSTTPYERYHAYLLKSYTYKRLYDYTHVEQNLNFALKEGLNSEHKNEVMSNIRAEKSFAYFDTHQYEKALLVMNGLKKDNYAYLPPTTKAWVIMQEGYIYMLHKNYSEAEKMYDGAIAILEKEEPSNLPNVYGKKIEMYHIMKLYDKRDELFEKALANTKKYHKIKYEIYLYEVLAKACKKSGDYDRAMQAQKKFDSLGEYYDSNNNLGKIGIVENKLEIEKRILNEKEHKKYGRILYVVIFSLAALLLLLYMLYKANKAKRKAAENENKKIYSEIEKYTKQLDEKGNSTLDISQYNLTERQIEIIELVKKGKSNKEIAAQLYISENTVKYHLKIIYTQLNINHRSFIK
ncbi:helix-turn-helix transcriptional regulator [Chryseobacterium sp. VD8]|uniref:helix-turn-helix transcriptional regulator n=1 Tax=Chryseobacterium sp. VD8 TaxID=3081254 RepID=UPI00301AACB1